jgi:hypothetical protein
MDCLECLTRCLWASWQVTNHPELHEYAARQTLESLKRGANHDAMVGAAAAIVGESPPTHASCFPACLLGAYQTIPTLRGDGGGSVNTFRSGQHVPYYVAFHQASTGIW